MKTLKFEIKNNDFIEYKKKTLARKLVHDFIRNEKLIRPEFCDLCEAKCKPDAHHTDYGQPFKIMWVCDKCHGLCHRSDSVYNPKNIAQTPINLEWDSGESVTISFTLPVKNFIAIKKYGDAENKPVSKIIRDCVMDFYAIEENQLQFKF